MYKILNKSKEGKIHGKLVYKKMSSCIKFVYLELPAKVSPYFVAHQDCLVKFRKNERKLTWINVFSHSTRNVVCSALQDYTIITRASEERRMLYLI